MIVLMIIYIQYTDREKSAQSVISVLLDKLIIPREQDTQENISEALQQYRDLIDRYDCQPSHMLFDPHFVWR